MTQPSLLWKIIINLSFKISTWNSDMLLQLTFCMSRSTKQSLQLIDTCQFHWQTSKKGFLKKCWLSKKKIWLQSIHHCISHYITKFGGHWLFLAEVRRENGILTLKFWCKCWLSKNLYILRFSMNKTRHVTLHGQFWWLFDFSCNSNSTAKRPMFAFTCWHCAC